MKSFFLVTVALLFTFQTALYSQVPNLPKTCAHKVVVDSVLQTKAYTYLKINERIGEKDSLQWVALPSFQPKTGDIYYYDSGMQMGEFHSKELDRTFNQIMFLSFMSTSFDVTEQSVVPPLVKNIVDSNATPPAVHKVVVKEVIQASGYTYLRVKEGNEDEWIAVVKIPAAVGQTYTYDDASLMTNFTSKELKRTFPKILFAAKLTKATAADKSKTVKKKAKGDKSIKIEPVSGAITIAELYKKKQSYSGQTVTVKGKVTKYSASIMDKNWIHIEDGTAYSGNADLTLTTDQEAKLGDIITIEGKLTLDKDFGSGYSFEIIVENAKIK